MTVKKAIVLFVFIFLVISIFFAFPKNMDYVIKIGKEKISVSEFAAYLYEQKKSFEAAGGIDIWEADFDGVSAYEKAKQNAVNSLVLVKTSISQAEKFNVNLDESSIKEAEETGNELAKEINKAGFYYDGKEIIISLKEAQKVARESVLQQKIYDAVIGSFEINDYDFELYLDNYEQENKDEMTDFRIIYAFAENSDEAEKIYSKMLNGEYINQKKAQNKIVSLKELDIPPDVKNEIYKLEKGSLSLPIACEDGFYIVYVDDVVIQDRDYIKEKLKQQYVADKKDELYQNQSSVWADNADVVKNEKVWNKITWLH